MASSSLSTSDGAGTASRGPSTSEDEAETQGRGSTVGRPGCGRGGAPSGASAQLAAPTPVRERTSSSAYLAGFFSLDSMVPSQPQRKPNGIEMMPGLVNGNQWKSCCDRIVDVGPETVGEKTTRTTAAMRPP